jgi:hypothetical protein
VQCPANVSREWTHHIHKTTNVCAEYAHAHQGSSTLTPRQSREQVFIKAADQNILGFRVLSHTHTHTHTNGFCSNSTLLNQQQSFYGRHGTSFTNASRNKRNNDAHREPLRTPQSRKTRIHKFDTANLTKFRPLIPRVL